MYIKIDDINKAIISALITFKLHKDYRLYFIDFFLVIQNIYIHIIFTIIL